MVFSCKKENELTFSEIQVTTNNNTIVEFLFLKLQETKLPVKP
ncbi:hypothetical protein JCM19302_2785 [Jejuia pallidilutea]|uniref:Uncharacterized protein n=1 Tax=Jejuia pallidilutea TaxID=504487 RepID=A0A090VZL7_9FLAO|nr:hypothetical protein JCM19302_2785 [Jejuia pallidilutea]